MGQEASVPQDNDNPNDGGSSDAISEESFGTQARAPPSSTNPPSSLSSGSGTTMSTSSAMHSVLPSSNHSGGSSSAHSKGGKGGGATKMINAVFHKRQQPPQQQHSHDSSSSTSDHHQQQYYAQQQQQQAYLMQQQQQQAHGTAPADPQTQQEYYAQQQQGNKHHHQPSYATSNDGIYNTSQGPLPSGQHHHAKKGRGAAALIHSMRSLTLKPKALSPSRAASKQQQQHPPQQQQTVNDWEKQWDEDSEEDDDDSDSEEVASPVAVAQHQAQQTKAPPKQQPPSRMDSNDDGVEWDTGALPQQAEPPTLQEEDFYHKPNVQMFLPLLRVLGKGSFGKVVLVQKRKGKERGALFAMKILRKTHLVKRRQIERTRTERKVLSVVNHPFIMKLHYAFQTPDKLYLVLDYCPGGELFFHLSRFRRFPERVARFYAAELLLAIGHLHKRGIIYRDLKPENVLLDADGNVKLGDMGLAKIGIRDACEGATSMCGTPEYMAPEVLQQHGHGFCVDYWGLGMLVYEMMTGLPPWYTTDRAKLFRRLKSAPLDIPSFFSPAAANCVAGLLERNPRRRLGVTGIRAVMEHEFYRSISWRALYGRRVEAPIKPCEGWKAPTSTSGESSGSTSNGGDYGQVQSQQAQNFSKTYLDEATANFDNTFTRMPVESQDRTTTPEEDLAEAELEEQLNEDTFIGFTFDDKDREEVQQQYQQSRQRTHHYGSSNGNSGGPGGASDNGESRHLD